LLRSSIEAIGEPVVVTAHSMGGFVAPLVADHPSVKGVVLLCATMPAALSGYEGGYSNVPVEALEQDERGRSCFRSAEALREYLYQDCTDDVVAWAWERLTCMAYRIVMDPYPLNAWPSVPTVSVIARDDRAVSGEFSRASARHIGARTIEVEGGH